VLDAEGKDIDISGLYDDDTTPRYNSIEEVERAADKPAPDAADADEDVDVDEDYEDVDYDDEYSDEDYEDVDYDDADDYGDED